MRVLRLSKRAIGKGNKSKKARGIRLDREASGATTGQPFSRESIRDSQIRNRNMIILATVREPEHSRSNVSPKDI
ncbi:hypothetical protein Ancab_017468 [Ancistrocladus abbreviatus]